MREKIPIKVGFQVVVTPSARGALITVGGIRVADLVASSSVVTQYQTLFDGLSIHPEFGDLLEEITGQTMLRKSGWNDEATGAVDPVVIKAQVIDLEPPVVEQPIGLIAKATDRFKHAFDWMTG